MPDELDRVLAALPSRPVEEPEPAPDIDTFLAEPEPEYDFLLAGLLERSERVLLTGPEGGGKTTLTRQVGVQAAAGIHPFTLKRMDPVRVLHIDLENSRRHVRRKLRPLRVQAGDRLDPSYLRVIVRPEGIDLLSTEDVGWLEAVVRVNLPELLICGPLYKMAGGDPTSEEVTRAVAGHLDRLRASYGVALLLEAHSPYGSGGSRPRRPYGGSLWSRWPEFGLHLAESGVLSHWRGARDEREWPTALTRGGEWPWMAATSARDVLWGRIVDEANQRLSRPTVRELVVALGSSMGTIHRVLESHREEWDALFPEETK